MKTSVTYHVRGIAHMWMPRCMAAFDRRYARDEYPFTSWTPRPLWNERAAELANIEDHLMTDTGDFSAVDDYEITRVVTVRGRDEHGATVARAAESIIRPWANPESECDYYDCFSEE